MKLAADMKTTIDFINEVKAKHGGASGYAVHKILNIGRSSAYMYISGDRTLCDETAIKVADELGYERGYVLACVNAERAKNEHRDEASRTWMSIAQGAMGCYVFVLLNFSQIAPGAF